MEKPEKRAVDISWAYGTQSIFTDAPQDAQALSAVTACINTISGAIASLPPYVYSVERSEGKKEATSHPLTRLIHNGVNKYGQTWHDFMESMMQDVLLYGNSLAAIKQSRGVLKELQYIPWRDVNVVYLPDGQIAFETRGGNIPMRRYLSSEVLHLRDRTDDGRLGVSRLKRAKITISSALELNQYVLTLYRRGLFPTGVLSYSGQMTDGTREMLRNQIDDKYSGAANSGRPMILSDGLQWQALPQNTADNEILQSRRFVTEEICRIFGVPPQLVGDLSNSTYNTASEAQRAFRQQCLAPWVNKIEQLINTRLMSANYAMEFDLQAIEMANAETRWKIYETATKNGILSQNEVRQAEGYAPFYATEPQVEKKTDVSIFSLGSPG